MGRTLKEIQDEMRKRKQEQEQGATANNSQKTYEPGTVGYKFQQLRERESTTVEDWVNQINSHAFEVSDYVSGGGLRSDEGYSSIQANRNRLREQGEYFKRKYAGNDDALTYLDSLLGVIDNIEVGEEYPMAQTEFSQISNQLQQLQNKASTGGYLTQEDVSNYRDLNLRYIKLGGKIFTPENASAEAVDLWKSTEAKSATSAGKIERQYKDDHGNHLSEDDFYDAWQSRQEYLDLYNTDLEQLDDEIWAMEKQGNQAAVDALRSKRGQVGILHLDDTVKNDPLFDFYLEVGGTPNSDGWSPIDLFIKETGKTVDPFTAFADVGFWSADHIRETEKETAQYLLGKVQYLDKVVGDKAAAEAVMDTFEKYDEYLTSTVSHRAAAHEAQQIADLPVVLSELAALVQSTGSGIENWYQGLNQWQYGEALQPTHNQLVTSYLTENGTLSTVGKYIAQTGQVVGNMLPTIALSYLTGSTKVADASVLLSSGGNAYGKALSEGYSVGEAGLYGVTVGAAEAFLGRLLGGNTISGGALDDTLLKFAANIEKAGLRIAAKYGIKIGSEELEELAQNFLEPAIASLWLGKKYDLPTIEANLETAIVTFMSTGLMETPGIVSSEVERSKYYKENYGDIQGELVDTAVNLPDGSRAKNLGTKYQTKIADGKDLSGNKLAALVNAIDKQYNAENLQKVQSAVEDRLTELGETGDVKALAAALTKNLAGKRLSNADHDVIDSSKYGQRVANEMDTENVIKGTHSSNWIRSVDTKRINVAEMRRNAAAKNQDTQENVSYPETAEVERVSPVKAQSRSIQLDGDTLIESSGETVNSLVIKKIDGKNVTVTVNGNKTVSANEVSFGSDQMHEAVRRVTGAVGMTPAGANMILSNSKSSNAGFISQALEAYEGGFNNQGISAVAEALDYRLISSAEARALYNQGVADAKAKTEAAEAKVFDVYKRAKGVMEQKGKKRHVGKLRIGKGVDVDGFNEQQTESAIAASEIAPSLSLDIVLYEDSSPNRFGFYKASEDAIYINVNARWSGNSMMTFTLAHELVHRAKVGSPRKYKAFQDFLIREYSKAGMSLNEMIAEQMAADKSLTREDALEEVICDAAQRMLTDTNAGKKLAAWGQRSAENRNFLKDLATWITEMFDNLRNLFKNAVNDSESARAFRKLDKNVQRILADMFVDMSIDAAEKLGSIKAAGMLDKINTTGEGGVKNKPGNKYDYTKPFAQQVDDYRNGLIPKGDTLLIGGTPKVYQSIGFNALPMTINTTHVDYALYGTKDADHYMGEAMLKQFPQSIENPIAVFLSNTHGTTSVIALLNFTVNGKQTVAPIVIDGYGRNNSIVIDSNAITSVYGKDNAVQQLYYAAKDNAAGKFALLYVNKNEAISLLQRAGHQLSGTLIPHDGFYHSIRESASPVKPKFESVTETQQFKRWFGDWKKHPSKASKIVNADGTPKVMYHGTNAENGDFYIFDESQAKKKGGLGFKALGKGNYFTSKKLDGTERYGSRVIAAYLDIKTPFVYDGGMSFREQVSNGLGIDAESMSYDEIQAAMRKKGYDGVIEYNKNGEIQIAVTFNSNQIKSATDNIGTFDGGNPDIRYKLATKMDAEYMDAVKRGDKKTAQEMVLEVAEDAGWAIRAYHGTSRGDRVGNVFLPERATSGPMSFFTSDRTVAEGYAKSKRDTSMAYDPDFDSYETQFRIKTKSQDIPLHRAWGYLPFDARRRITEKAGQLRENWDGDNELILDTETNEANGGFQWQLKEARGNAITALTEQWLNSGTLFNEESKFLDVLEMAGVTEEVKKIGMDAPYFKDPNERHEKVYDTVLKITKPFDTATVNEQFVADLESWYEDQDQTKYVRENMESDLWDKNGIDAYEFADRLRRDIENGTSHAWTSIPDSVTDYLKSKGYDGIKDTGGKFWDGEHIVWIPFYSEQIKSAEPVTYDADGNVIPLSERFNSEKKDIRYKMSVGEVEDAYMEAAEKEDKAEAKKYVDAYALKKGFEADADGEPDLLFHGTAAFGFTKPDTSFSDDSLTFWATPNMGVAGSYYEGSNYRVREIGKEKIVPKGKPLDYTSSMEEAITAAQSLSSGLSRDYSRARFVKEAKVMKKARKNIDKAVRAAQKVLNGDHAIAVKKIASRIVNAASENSYKSWTKAVNFDSWQRYQAIIGIRYIDLDIPDRFNPDKSDISKITDIDPDVFRMIYHIGNVLNDLELDEKAKVDGEEVWLGDLVAEYNSVIAEKGIYGLYHKQDNAFVYDCEGVNWNKISVPPEAKDYFASDTCTTRELAEWAFRNRYDAIRLDNIIDISQFALKEARKPSTVWAFKNPERQLRSADPITYDDNGNVIPLSERFNTNKGDFRYKLAVGVSRREMLVDAFEDMVSSPEERQLIDTYRNYISTADQIQAQIDGIRKEIRQKVKDKAPKSEIDPLRNKVNTLQAELDANDAALLSMEGAKPLRDLTNRAIRESREKALEKQREALSAKYRESREKASERRKASELRGKINRLMKDMQSTMRHPTEGKYIPAKMFGAMVKVLEVLDSDTDQYNKDGSINKAQQRREEMREALYDLRREYELFGEDATNIDEYDEYVEEYLKELEDNFQGKKLRELTMDEAYMMYDILKSINDVIMDARKVIGWDENTTVYDVGRSIAENQAEVTKDRKNNKRSKVSAANDAALNLTLSPMRIAERLSGYEESAALLEVFRKLEQGNRDANFFKMESYKMFEELTDTGDKLKKYEDAIFKPFGKEYTDAKGNKFRVTKMQMMQAILSAEREQSNKKLEHISKDGLKFADVDIMAKGDLKKAIDPEKLHHIVNPFEAIADFTKELANDKWAQAYMATARKYFNEKAKDAINKASLATKHRIIATETAYIPFEVDKNAVYREVKDTRELQKTINGYGMLQETKAKAPQALIITGLNNVVERHIGQTANVAGLAVAVRNFNKVWNAKIETESGEKMVKAIIAENWGAKTAMALEKAVMDLQGNRPNETPFWYQKLKSNIIKETFWRNLSVVAKQIGSMITANSSLDSQRLISAMFFNLASTRINRDAIAAEVEKYTASAWVRAQGLHDSAMAKLSQDGKRGKIGKFVDKGLEAMTSMDYTVALSLWKYCKEDVAKRTGLTGEELLKETAKHFDNVIESTQSMGDALHRPEIQRSNNVIYEGLAMFKTDLYQTAGQFRSVVGRYKANPSKDNKKAVARTVLSIVETIVYANLISGLMAMLRYKVDPYRDDDEEFTVDSFFEKIFTDSLGDIPGYFLPMLGDAAVDTFNIWFGEGGWGDVLENMVYVEVNELVDAVGNTIKQVQEDGFDGVSAQQWRKLLGQTLQAFGVPANTIFRTMDSISNYYKDIANGQFHSFEAGVERSAGNYAHLVAKYYGDDEDTARDWYDKAIDDLATRAAKGGEVTEEHIKAAKSSVKSQIGKMYRNGEISKSETKSVLKKFFQEKDDDIYWLVREWEYKKENGADADYGKYDDYISAVKTGKRLEAVTNEYLANGVSEETLGGQITNYFKPIYLAASTSEKNRLRGYLVNAFMVLGYTKSEANRRIKNWKPKEEEDDE